MAVVKNSVAVKGLQVAVNFGEDGREGLPRSGNPVYIVSTFNGPGPSFEKSMIGLLNTVFHTKHEKILVLCRIWNNNT
jgi:hypothetical protein